MTRIHVQNSYAHTHARCDDCGQTWAVDALAEIVDVEQRIDAGGEVPAGQCPDEECGALCYVVRDDEKPT